MILGDTWRGSEGTNCIVAIKGPVVKHYFVRDAEEAHEKARALSQAGHDMYFAPSTIDTAPVEHLQQTTNPAAGRLYTGRSQEAVATVGAFWLDIDCGEGAPYPSWKHGLLALLA